MEINMEKYVTKEVQIYEKIKSLRKTLEELEYDKNFIKGNYDSTVKVSIEASSYHNFNNKDFKEISLPVEIILKERVNKDFVLEKLDLKINEINEELDKLDTEFDNMKK